MNRRLLILSALALMAAALGFGWWLMRQRPADSVDFLVARGMSRTQAARFVELLGGQTKGIPEPLVTSGSLEAREVAMVSELGGRVVAVLVEEGLDVRSGEALIELDQNSVIASIGEAQAAVAEAEAERDALAAGAHPATILAAEARLQQALTQREGAQLALSSARQLLANPQDLEAKILETETSAELAAIQAELAEAQISAAIAQRDRYRAQGTLEEKGLYQIYDQQVVAAKEALGQAQAASEGAQATSEQLRAIRANPLALLAQVHEAEGNLEIATVGVAVARAALADLESGPTVEDMAVAEAQVEVARAALAALEAKREMLTLRAPLAGKVASQAIYAGEIAQPGATLMTLADLSEITLTIFVPENELERVYIGQEVNIRVDAFPTEVFSGRIAYISPRAEFTPRNVQTEEERVSMVFAVRLRLPNADTRLRPGMSAEVTLPAAP
jgi:HlyD family secretion protein